MNNSNLTKTLIIEPKYLGCKSHIENLIKKREHMCDEDGYYIEKIYKINSIKFNRFYDQNFSGNILVDVNFNADIVSIQNNTIIEADIIKANEDGIIAQGIYPIYIIIDSDYENLSYLKEGDKIKVNILKWDINRNKNKKKNVIKAVGEFISLVNEETEEENEEKKDEEIQLNIKEEDININILATYD